MCLSRRLPLLDSTTEPEPESEPEPATSHQFTDRYLQRTSPSAPPANAIIDDNLSPLHGLGCQDGVLKTNHKATSQLESFFAPCDLRFVFLRTQKLGFIIVTVSGAGQQSGAYIPGRWSDPRLYLPIRLRFMSVSPSRPGNDTFSTFV